MASFKCLCLIFINVVVVCNAISAFTDVLDNAENCEQKCTKSYAPHTYPNGEENKACQRGCRLLTVTKFITSDEPKNPMNEEDDGRSHARVLCDRSCVEAYSETSSLKDACQIGCEKQEKLSIEKESLEKNEESESVGIQLMKPVMEVREVTSKVMGMLRIVQTSLTTYFRGENNEMVAVEGPVRIMVQVNNPNQSPILPISDVSQESNEIKSLENDVVKVPLTQEAGGFAKFYENFEQQDIINYLVLTSMFLCGIFFVYLLLSRQSGVMKKKAQKFESESKTLPAHALPVKLVRPEDLTKLSLMDEEEAPALPMKFKLPDNTNV